MPRFKTGDICILQGMKISTTERTQLLKYDGEQIQIVQFEGNVIINKRLFTNGDWYQVRAADGTQFYTREHLLFERPHGWNVLGTWERIKEDTGWSPKHKEESQ
jgi:hypothetical protein